MSDPDDDTAGDPPSYGPDDDPEDECPFGGEHEWVEIMSATQTDPLFIYCRRCKQEPE